MNQIQVSRWSGLVAMVGGTICGMYGTLLARRPAGISGGPHRNSDDLAPWFITGIVLIVVGLIGLYVQHNGRAGKLGTVAVGLALVGLALLAAGSATAWIYFAFGFLAVVASLLLLGIATLFAGMIPHWASSLLRPPQG